jgi:hypothetical protein
MFEVFELSLLLTFSNQTFVHISYLTMCAACPTHLILDLISVNSWSRVQIMKLLYMSFSSSSHHFSPLRFIYSPKDTVLKHPQFVPFP